ncbi:MULTISPECIES: phosphate acyltransferase PlsX [unclassified Photobacterium]|uniref:phosphate acyltransferase PlsX n=1 Tax=unclassified Photobacterium TaxID=2628852 RepID=UPI001B8BD3AF|nr:MULTISPECIES: phosphate acyltransferase PlsX [unclassified Photobacterium]MDO6705754.1 phosphate acyltransferase PlsX [Photobacterium sp. 1_MG-2023]QUJ68361.1 phosphate acyltransferase PlsX [Photobacterium sp. GJ3]
MTGLTVALDAMGGDFGPQVTVPAAVQALLQYPSLNLLLYGDQSAITTQLSSLNHLHHPRLTIVHCDHAIADHTRPSQALRQSQGSSMRRALDAVAEGEADACVSAGNTGALMALARYSLKQLPGVERPALVSAIPSRTGGKTWLLDLGANVSCDADTLFQFAVMGSVLAEQEMTGRPPRVALLNIGSEEIKGNDLVKRCASMLSRSQDVHYIGYVEGNELYDGKADVIVCDGFVGNVSLKTSEGVANLFIDSFKRAVSQHPLKRILAKWLFRDLFRELQSLNPDQYNGASLLGLRGIVVKSHGSADIAAFTNAIGEAVHEIKRKIPTRISDRLEHVLLERHY